jgi:hypothetical protein
LAINGGNESHESDNPQVDIHPHVKRHEYSRKSDTGDAARTPYTVKSTVDFSLKLFLQMKGLRVERNIQYPEAE